MMKNMNNFTERYEIIYKKFFELAKSQGEPSSKLALSRFLGVTQANMQSWEKGQIPTAKGLQSIHDKLGFAYSWLITGEGPQFDEAAGGDVAALKARVAELEGELAEADRVNRKLTARLLVGKDDQGTTENEKAAG